ncbi:MAG: D-glycero-beta-D-manno-heptose-7-phosphate kinase [Blastocatellia bacterium]
MNRERALEIVEGFTGRRLIVLGDLMLDEYIWGEVRRISPEAPVPVVEVRRESWNPGGAGNVVSNLLELEALPLPIGVIGEDQAGASLRQYTLDRCGDAGGIIVDASRPTTRKTRIIAHSQQMARADRENRAHIAPEIEDQVIAAFQQALGSADAVIVSDYGKGLLTPRVLQATLAAAHQHGLPVCLDPKLRDFAAYRPVTVITPNQGEAERATGVEITDGVTLLSVAQKIRAAIECPNVLITRGEHGMTLLDARGVQTHIPAMAREVYDVTGAGDTVIATLALSLAAAASMIEAAIIANYAAGVVVGKIGAAAISQKELRETLQTLP